MAMFTYQTYLFSCYVLSAGHLTPMSLSSLHPHPPPSSTHTDIPLLSCPLLLHSSHSSPGGAVTYGNLFSPWSWLSVVKCRSDTGELRPSVILSAATQYTHHESPDNATAVIQSRGVCVVPVCQRRWMQGGKGDIKGRRQWKRECRELLSLPP